MQKVYEYVAIDQNEKRIKGVVRAANPRLAKYILKESNYTRILNLKFSWKETLKSIFKKQPSYADLRELIFAFYNAQKSGISLRMIVDTLPDMFTGQMKKKAEMIKFLVKDKGYTFSEVLKKSEIPDFIVNAVKAAEAGGNTVEVLERIVKILDIMSRTESEIRKSIIMPKIVISLAAIAFVFILYYAVPKLATVYQNVESLPNMTENLINMSKFVVNNTIESFGLAIAFVVSFWVFFTPSMFIKMLSSIHSISERLDQKYKIPTLKKLTKKLATMAYAYESMKICYFLDLLYTAGIKPNKIMIFLKDLVDAPTTKKKLDTIASRIQAGKSIAEAFKLSGMDETLTAFVKAGEAQNNLSHYLTSYAEYQERNYYSSVEKVKLVLPTLLMIVISVFVISMITYLVLPLYNVSG